MYLTHTPKDWVQVAWLFRRWCPVHTLKLRGNLEVGDICRQFGCKGLTFDICRVLKGQPSWLMLSLNTTCCQPVNSTTTSHLRSLGPCSRYHHQR